MQKDENPNIQVEEETQSDDALTTKRVKTDRYGGFNPILVELSDALSSDAFLSKYLD